MLVMLEHEIFLMLMIFTWTKYLLEDIFRITLLKTIILKFKVQKSTCKVQPLEALVNFFLVQHYSHLLKCNYF